MTFATCDSAGGLGYTTLQERRNLHGLVEDTFGHGCGDEEGVRICVTFNRNYLTYLSSTIVFRTITHTSVNVGFIFFTTKTVLFILFSPRNGIPKRSGIRN